jgi:DNA-binding transcriptional LysR family regulator
VVVFSGRHPALAWCDAAFRDASVVLRSESMQVTANAIAAGLGLGVIPQRAARGLPELRLLSPPVAHGTAWLVVHPELRKLPRIRVVVDALATMFRADATPT